MLQITLKNWSFDADLQIILADVKLEIENNIWIDEPLCIDVGLPALLLSGIEATTPNRWAPAAEWQKMPFFVCGCGDAECRGFSFVVEHVDETWLKFIEVDERMNDQYRIAGEAVVSIDEYRDQVEAIGHCYLQFVRDLAYKPYLPHTIEIVEHLLMQLTLLRAG